MGASVTSLLFTIGKQLLAIYLGRVGFESTYGAAWTVVIFLVWVYYSAQLFFLGAEFTKVYTRNYGSHSGALALPALPRATINQEGERIAIVSVTKTATRVQYRCGARSGYWRGVRVSLLAFSSSCLLSRRWRRPRLSKESRSSIFNSPTASRWIRPTWRAPCRSKKVSRCTPSMWRTPLMDYSPPAVSTTSWWRPSLRAEGVIVRFVTQNARFLGGITVEGKVLESPNRAQVDNAAQLSLGAPFHDDDVTEAVDRIHRLLQANGFYEAQVTPTVERGDDAQQIFLTFQVHEGKRAKYDTPTITASPSCPTRPLSAPRAGAFRSSIGGGTSPVRAPAAACKAS